MVLVTDGYVGVEAQAFRLVRERLPEASCFPFGIGSAVNRGLIEGLARAGQGEPTVVLRPEDAQAAAARLERIISAPVLSQLHYEFEGLDARDVLPGALPDLLAERPVTLLGRYRGVPGGKIVLTGQSAAGPYRKELDLSGAAPDVADPTRLKLLFLRSGNGGLDDGQAAEVLVSPAVALIGHQGSARVALDATARGLMLLFHPQYLNDELTFERFWSRVHPADRSAARSRPRCPSRRRRTSSGTSEGIRTAVESRTKAENARHLSCMENSAKRGESRPILKMNVPFRLRPFQRFP